MVNYSITWLRQKDYVCRRRKEKKYTRENAKNGAVIESEYEVDRLIREHKSYCVVPYEWMSGPISRAIRTKKVLEVYASINCQQAKPSSRDQNL